MGLHEVLLFQVHEIGQQPWDGMLFACIGCQGGSTQQLTQVNRGTVMHVDDNDDDGKEDENDDEQTISKQCKSSNKLMRIETLCVFFGLISLKFSTTSHSFT